MGRHKLLDFKLIDDFCDDYISGMGIKALESKYKLGKNTAYDYLKYPNVCQQIYEKRLLKVKDKLYERTQGVTVQTGDDRDGDPIYKDYPPDVPSMRLFFEYEGKWNPAQKVEAEVKGSLSLTDLIKADNSLKNDR